MRIMIAILAAVLIAAAPAHADGISVTGEETLSPRLRELTVTTPALDFPARIRILLPTGYADHPRLRYPVLYLLHGSFDDAASWTTKGDAEAITAGAPVIVVMPAAAGKGNGGGWASDWRNEGRGGVPKWETFTIGELIAWVDGRYRTRARRSGRAIAGLSMGGFSAMSYAARHPDLFAAAASFSGAVDTNVAEVQPIIQLEALADGGATPDAIWGPRATDEVYWRAHNPADLAVNLRGMTLSVRTGNGSPGPEDDTPYDPIEAGVHDMSSSFDRALTGLGIAHVFDDYGAGTHSWPYWQRDLKLDLPRLEDTFAHPVRGLVPFTYTSAESRYDVYGWSVELDRPVTEFSTLAGSPRSIGLTGSGRATVVTAPLYRPGSSHDLSIGDAALQTVTADAGGRLTVPIDLGPASTGQQFRPGTVTRQTTVRVAVPPRCSRSRIVRIRLRRGLVARSVTVGGRRTRTARRRVVRVDLRGRPAGRYRIRIAALGNARRVIVHATRRLCTAT